MLVRIDWILVFKLVVFLSLFVILDKVLVIIVFKIKLYLVIEVEDGIILNLNLFLVNVNGEVLFLLVVFFGRVGNVFILIVNLFEDLEFVVGFFFICFNMFFNWFFKNIEIIVGGVLLVFKWWLFLVFVVDIFNKFGYLLIVFIIV